MPKLQVEWIDAGRDAECPADPLYPQGVDIEERAGAARTCFTRLRYPAVRCGVWQISCPHCPRVAVVTAAGRADDPRSFRMACRPVKEGAA
jgi:hypothetical protein